MQNHLYNFGKKLIIFTIIFAIAGFLVTYVLPDQYITPVLPYLFLFFFSVTLLIHYILLKLKAKKESAFIRMFMLLTFAKLLFFLFILIIYAFIYRNDAIAFIIDFFVLYFFFTIFEVNQTLKAVKLNSGKKEG